MIFNTTILLALFKEVYMTELKVTNVDTDNQIVQIEIFNNVFEYKY